MSLIFRLTSCQPDSQSENELGGSLKYTFNSLHYPCEVLTRVRVRVRVITKEFQRLFSVTSFSYECNLGKFDLLNIWLYQ